MIYVFYFLIGKEILTSVNLVDYRSYVTKNCPLCFGAKQISFSIFPLRNLKNIACYDIKKSFRVFRSSCLVLANFLFINNRFAINQRSPLLEGRRVSAALYQESS